MATVTYPNCPCCNPPSGSGSGGGSGSGDGQSGSGDGDVPRTGVCFSRAVPTTLYVTFGGAMAGWGTVRVVYTSTTGGKYIWQYLDGTGPNPFHLPQIACTESPFYNGYLNDWTLVLQFCGSYGPGDLADGEVLLGFSSPGGNACSANPDQPNGISPVVSYDPFYAEGSGVFGSFTFPPCDCAGSAYSFVITETPP